MDRATDSLLMTLGREGMIGKYIKENSLEASITFIYLLGTNSSFDLPDDVICWSTTEFA